MFEKKLKNNSSCLYFKMRRFLPYGKIFAIKVIDSCSNYQADSFDFSLEISIEIFLEIY